MTNDSLHCRAPQGTTQLYVVGCVPSLYPERTRKGLMWTHEQGGSHCAPHYAPLSE